MDLIRSWMFVPGHRQKMIDKALGLNADAIMLDIEDGVAPNEKDSARKNIARVLGPRQSRRLPGPLRAHQLHRPSVDGRRPGSGCPARLGRFGLPESRHRRRSAESRRHSRRHGTEKQNGQGQRQAADRHRKPQGTVQRAGHRRSVIAHRRDYFWHGRLRPRDRPPRSARGRSAGFDLCPLRHRRRRRRRACASGRRGMGGS